MKRQNSETTHGAFNIVPKNPERPKFSGQIEKLSVKKESSDDQERNRFVLGRERSAWSYHATVRVSIYRVELVAGDNLTKNYD